MKTERRTQFRYAIVVAFCAHAAAPAAAVAQRAAQPAQQQRGDTTVLLAAAPRFPGGGTLVQEISIGSESQGLNYLLNRIMSVIATRDGYIWVLDGPATGAGEYQLRRYDASGKFIANVSRMGQGPGELSRPQSPLVELPDGRIAVRDIPRNRVDVFAASGAPSATWMFGSTRFPYGSGGGGTISADTSGIVYLPAYIQRPFTPGPRTAPLPEDEERQTRVIVRLRKDGTIIDSLLQPDLPKVDLPTARVDYRTPGGGFRGGSAGAATSAAAAPANRGYYSILSGVPFNPQSDWNVSPLGYVVTTVGNRYAIDMRIPRATGNARGSQPPKWRAGDPVVSIRRNVTPVPVGAVERRERREALELSLSKGPPDLPPGTVIRPLPEIPTVKPLIRRVMFGLDGRFWLQLSAPSERYDPSKHGEALRRSAESAAGWIEPTLYDVFEPSGVYVGQVKIPFGISLSSMRGDVMYAVHTGDDGVQSVRRYRISWK